MIFAYFTLFVALLIEVVGAYYSITGLAAIFSGAVIPILIMGGSLEVGKVTAAIWLKNNWHRASLQFKLYLLPAVALLMFVTSMGIFGFLSKAHNDQTLVSGDVGSKIAIYDEKIKTEKENIEANRKALKQMDEGVDSVLGRSTDEKGADKAVALRKTQQKERIRLQAEISQSQKSIAELNDIRAPIAAEVRKVEAEVGPIKYIAALIYGDNPDANILEKAVVWVIMMIVAVFDPLALVLILAAQHSIRWAQEEKKEHYEPDEGPLTDNQIEQIRKMAQADLPLGKVVGKEELFSDYDEPVFEREEIPLEEEPTPEQEPLLHPLAHIEIPEIHPDDRLHLLSKRFFMSGHPGVDERTFHALHQAGKIDQLPWHEKEHINNLPISDSERKQLLERFVNTATPTPAETDQFGLEADNVDNKIAGEVRGFGTQFPTTANKGDMFLRVDRLPSALYKFNGNIWIEVDKTLSDQHAYDDAYIDHLIEKIDTGEYDPELLSDAERDSIERRLQNTRQV
jgi:hypothetical protein